MSRYLLLLLYLLVECLLLLNLLTECLGIYCYWFTYWLMSRDPNGVSKDYISILYYTIDCYSPSMYVLQRAYYYIIQYYAIILFSVVLCYCIVLYCIPSWYYVFNFEWLLISDYRILNAYENWNMKLDILFYCKD